jgi:carboxymethylenebutenolidase
MKRMLAPALAALLIAVPATAQDSARARVDKSPRHGEWVKVKQGSRDVECFLVYPEVKDKATAVLVIHEIFGLSDWVQSVADQLAEAGYIAIAPDLLSGKGGTKAFSSRGEVTKAVSSLPAEQVTADLNAVEKYVSQLPACNGKVVVAGFCWGGTKSFAFATENHDIKAAFVFYGTGPKSPEAMAQINCPVYGFYGENDARVNSTLSQSTELMKKAGKTYEPVIYAGAGHGFMRVGDEPGAKGPNKKARDEAWQRWLGLLKGI